MKIRPTFANVVVILDEQETKAGSIELPNNIRDTRGYVTGKVLAVGPGHRIVRQLNERSIDEFYPPPCKVGDRVILAYWNAEKFNLDHEGKRMIVAQDMSILGIVEE